jgi:hypothetical protein
MRFTAALFQPIGKTTTKQKERGEHWRRAQARGGGHLSGRGEGVTCVRRWALPVENFRVVAHVDGCLSEVLDNLRPLLQLTDRGDTVVKALEALRPFQRP